MTQFSHELRELLFHCGKISMAIRSLYADDEIHAFKLVLIFSEQLAQDSAHIVSIDRVARDFFGHNQAQARPAQLVILIMYGQEIPGNPFAEIKNG